MSYSVLTEGEGVTVTVETTMTIDQCAAFRNEVLAALAGRGDVHVHVREGVQLDVAAAQLLCSLHRLVEAQGRAFHRTGAAGLPEGLYDTLGSCHHRTGDEGCFFIGTDDHA